MTPLAELLLSSIAPYRIITRAISIHACPCGIIMQIIGYMWCVGHNGNVLSPGSFKFELLFTCKSTQRLFLRPARLIHSTDIDKTSC